MNLTNLKKMFNHVLLNVPEKKIKMVSYRTGDYDKHACDSTGCVIGHCTILDEWENIPIHHDRINFRLWSEKFTGLYCESLKWKWCFRSIWPNKKEQILLRIKYLIDNQAIPEDWNCYDPYYKLPVVELKPYEI